MKTFRVVCLLLLAPLAAAAQELSLDCLPANTSAYVLWHGMASVEPARRANALLRIWHDPDFAPIRHAIAQQFVAGMKKKAEGRSSVQPAFGDVRALLENPLVVGVSGVPNFAALRSQGSASPELSAFLLYDTTGKLELHRRFLEQAQAAATEKPLITSYEFAGTTVEKVSDPKETNYRAYTGHYFVLSNQKAVIEDIIQRTQAREAPADSIRKNALFQAWRSFAGEVSLAEFFARLPDLSKIEFPGPGVPERQKERIGDLRGVLRALHVERLQALAGSVSLVGERARLRVALLGDTSPGSLFDLFGESRSSFATLALAPAGASYNVVALDLAAFYQTLRNALKAGLPAEKSGFIEAMEAGLSGQTGMSMTELLGLFAGEFAWTTSEMPTGASTVPGIFAVAIRRPEDVLRVVRLFLANQITSDERQGDATYLAFTTSYKDSQTGAERKRFYYAAVTPHMLLFGQRKTVVSEAASRLAAAADAPAPSTSFRASRAGAAGTLDADPQFLRLRASLPKSLTSLAYSDLSRFPWEKFAEGFVEGFSKSIQKSSAEPSGPAAAPSIDPKALATVLARHLHVFCYASWKNSNGLFVESGIE